MKDNFRAPEFAYVVPLGDFDALCDVLRIASGLWNGAGSLLLPIAADGEMDHWATTGPQILGVDAVLVHKACGDAALRQANTRWPGRAAWLEQHQIENEMSPLWLGPKPAAAGDRPLLRVPRVGQNKTVARQVLAAWGHVDTQDEDVLDYVVPVPTDADAWIDAVVGGQVDGTSPLELGTRLVQSGGVNGPHTRCLFVFSARPTFNQVVEFWNLRARRSRFGHILEVLGAPVGAFARPACLDELTRWAEALSNTRPNFKVWASARDAPTAAAALENAGFRRSPNGRVTWWSSLPETREPLEYRLGLEHLPLRLNRGNQNPIARELREGLNPVEATPPLSFAAISWFGGRMRYELSDLPVAFPISDATAQHFMPNARASADGSGVVISVDCTTNSLRLDIRKPSLDEHLAYHLSDRGFVGRLSDKGRMLTAVLDRVRHPSDLDVLAEPDPYRLLEVLTPQTPERLARAIRRELRDLEFGDKDPAAVAARLTPVGPGASATIQELSSRLGWGRGRVLQAVDGLARSGWVEQGRRAECPRCATEEFWSLRELDERLVCRGCDERFRPAVRFGKEESPGAYRLDPLVARVMLQGGGAVLLTIRRVLMDVPADVPYGLWPGLELLPAGKSEPAFEIDLLLATRKRITVGECKTQAGSLDIEEATKAIAAAERLGGSALLAAAAGDWADEVVAFAADRKSVDLLDADELRRPRE